MAKNTLLLRLQEGKEGEVLEIFIADQAPTRLELRVKLRVLDELAASLFALIVFLCDGLLNLKRVTKRTADPDQKKGPLLRHCQEVAPGAPDASCPQGLRLQGLC